MSFKTDYPFYMTPACAAECLAASKGRRAREVERREHGAAARRAFLTEEDLLDHAKRRADRARFTGEAPSGLMPL